MDKFLNPINWSILVLTFVFHIILQSQSAESTILTNQNQIDIIKMKNSNKYSNYTQYLINKTKLRFGPPKIDQTVKSREAKGFLNIFDILVFDNLQCKANTSNQINGTCYSKQECHKLKGTPMGTCADGIGVCCVFKFNCGSFTQQYVIYFQNIEYPLPSIGPISCTLTIDIRKDTKQIFLEFLTFELQRPAHGDCISDEFSVIGQNRNFLVPSICGINTDQHMFIEVDQSPTNILHLSVFGKANNQRSFNIKMTQLKERIAPRGCLQYYTEPAAIIKSFNYDESGTIIESRGGSYFNNLNYAICIERVKNMCSISYTNEIEDEELQFDIVNADVEYKSQSNDPSYCADDFLAINGLRLCGEKLVDSTRHRTMNDLTLITESITDYGNGPIVLPFFSDSMYVGRGFQIFYEQNYCDSKFLATNQNLG